MMTIYYDAIFKISEFLTDEQKIKLTMTSKAMNILKYKFMYHDVTSVTKIMHLTYFDNFENVTVYDQQKCPKYAKHVTLISSTLQPILKNYLTCITHLIFWDHFDDTIQDKIPPTITYLKFGYLFNRPVENNIPPSVTHVVFGRRFNQPINKLSLVKEITLHKNYSLPISDDMQKKIIWSSS